MSTLVFAGTTFWDDSTTGHGRLGINEGPKLKMRSYNPLPRTSDVIPKGLRFDPGSIQVKASYRLINTEFAALRSTIEGALEDEGSIVYPVAGGSATIGDCVLDQWTISRGDPALLGGTIRHDFELIFLFVRLTA